MNKKLPIIVLTAISLCLLVAVAFLGIELKKAKNQEPVIVSEQDSNQQIEEEPEVVYVEKEVEVVKYIEKQPEEETPVVTQTPSSSKKESKPAPEPEKKEMDYEDFINLTAAKQDEIINSYSSLEDFLNWYYEVKAEYDELNAPVITGGDFR